jgi:hypothetical protein
LKTWRIVDKVWRRRRKKGCKMMIKNEYQQRKRPKNQITETVKII